VIADELGAQRLQVEAAQTTLTLSQARYDRGLDPYLQLLDAQRSLYAAQQVLVATELAEATSRLNLYKALGGGGETPARGQD
jgi:outer membrane protein TolC